MQTQPLILSLCLVGMTVLSSCFSLGQKALPTPAERPLFTFSPCASASLKLSIQQLPQQTLSTAKTPWDTHLRYVYPFTQRTVQFEVKAQNTGTQVLHLTEEASLQLPQGELSQSLALDFFEKVWPAKAVQNAQQLHDRSMAMGEVIEHRWHQRQVFPGETYTGWVSFPVAVLERTPTQLNIAYREDTSSSEETLSCTMQASTQG